LQSHVQSPDVAVLFLYCNFKERSDQTVVNLVTSLLQQLLLRFTTVPPGAKALYDRHKRHITRPSLDEVTTLLRSLISSFNDIFVVIDALDEAEEEVRSTLVELVTQLSPTLRLLCTSRFLEDIGNIFQSRPKLEIFAREDDIRKYLKARIMAEGRLRRHVDAEPRLLHDIIESIVSKVQGM
jgi:hypothetical protein